jgi:hypothetical protein
MIGYTYSNTISYFTYYHIMDTNLMQINQWFAIVFFFFFWSTLKIFVLQINKNRIILVFQFLFLNYPTFIYLMVFWK